MRFRKFLKPYKTRGSSFREHTITLKGATGENLEEAKVMLRRIMGREAMRFRFLLESNRIDDTERSQYEALIGTDKTDTKTD